MKKITFSEWLVKRESATTTGSSMTSTADVANFSRPIFSEPVRRSGKKKNEKKK